MENWTIETLAASAGIPADTLYRKAGRLWPDRKWSKYSALTEDEASALLAPKSKKGRPASAPKPARPAPDPAAVPKSGQPKPGGGKPKRAATPWSAIVLVALVAAPVLASVRNVYSVTWHLSEHSFDAAVLTTVLCASAPGFIAAGVRRWYVLALAVGIMLFEAFCNLAIIYGGLMGVGTSGNPTTFLKLVCDIFGSGPHWTSIWLGSIAALILALVQFTAIYQLKKS